MNISIMGIASDSLVTGCYPAEIGLKQVHGAAI